jgi:hypothetical protein
MKKIFTALLLLGTFDLFSQANISFEGDLGASIPMHQDLSKVFGLGFDLNTGLAFNVLNEKLYLKPAAGVKWYFKDADHSLTEHLQTWKVGLELRYYCYKNDKVMVAPYAKVDYNWTSNHYSSPSYDPVLKQNTGLASASLLKGKDYSFALGSMVHFQRIYFKINYELYSPTLILKEDIVDSINHQGFVVDPNPTFNLNSLSLAIGYSIYLK